MENKLYVSPSPHIHGGDSISKNMYGVLIALVPAFLVSLYFFGLGALIVTVASVFFCVLFEYLIQKFLMKKEPTIYDHLARCRTVDILCRCNNRGNRPLSDERGCTRQNAYTQRHADR